MYICVVLQRDGRGCVWAGGDGGSPREAKRAPLVDMGSVSAVQLARADKRVPHHGHAVLLAYPHILVPHSRAGGP